MEIKNLRKYKAGNLKHFRFTTQSLFSLNFFSVVEDHQYIERDLVFVIFSKTLSFIAFNPTPMKEDVTSMKLYIQQFYGVYSKLFYFDDHHNHCFTTSIHAVLHLPEILEYFGSPLKESQFLPESVIGEVGGMKNTYRHLETHFLNQTLHCICIMMIYGDVPFQSMSIVDENIHESSMVFEPVT